MAWEIVGFNIVKFLFGWLIKPKLREDSKKLTFVHKTHDAGETDFQRCEVKLSFINKSDKPIFIKFCDPTIYHKSQKYELFTLQGDLNTTYNVTSKNVTIISFEFGFIGGRTTVQDFRPRKVEFEIGYHVERKFHKLFIYYKDIAFQSPFTFVPL